MYPDDHSLNHAVFQALRIALTLSPEEASAHIFRAYTDAPPAEPLPSETVCYYHLRTDPNAPELYEVILESGTPIVSSFFPSSLILVFYGPDCEAWAHRAQHFLFQDGAGEPRQLLRAASLFPVPSSRPPTILYEETGKTFRKRADLVIPMRLLSNEPYKLVPTVESPPDVSVHYS